MKFFRPLTLSLCVLLLASCVHAQTLRVAAAADLQFAMKDLGTQFEKKTGTKILVSYGSSGNFSSQIENGAPFDVFFSADALYPERLIKSGAADAQSLFTYAQGHLVLWAPTGTNLQLAQKGFSALQDPRVDKIAIANPEHAPYGRAAQATLDHLSLAPVVQPHLRIAENIAQAAQYADSGNAQVGFISLTSALTPRLSADGHFLRVPVEDYPPILQGAIVVRGSANADAARRFLTFLHRPEIARELSSSGLIPFPRP